MWIDFKPIYNILESQTVFVKGQVTAPPKHPRLGQLTAPPNLPAELNSLRLG